MSALLTTFSPRILDTWVLESFLDVNRKLRSTKYSPITFGNWERGDDADDDDDDDDDDNDGDDDDGDDDDDFS